MAEFSMNNLVVYVPDSDHSIGVALDLESPWKLSVGLKPNINHARVSYAEFAKLGASPGGTGRVVFFNRQQSYTVGVLDDADVTIKNVVLVDAEPASPEEIGQTLGPDAAHPLAAQVLVWRVYFADFRDRFVSPRGGRLEFGLVNPTSADAVGGQSPDSNTKWSMSDLIDACLTAMGINQTTDYDQDGADAVDAPHDIQWRGNHAPTELQKLLDYLGWFFCPNQDGTASLNAIGNGTQPTFSGQGLPVITLPNIDRRGNIIVFESHPSAGIVTETVTRLTADELHFVAQNPNGKWVDVNELTDVTNPQTLVQMNFAAVGGVTSKERAEQLWQQMYRVLKIIPGTDANPGQAPILPVRYEADWLTSGRQYSPELTAPTWTRNPDGTVATTSATPIRIDIAQTTSDYLIFAKHERIGHVDAGNYPQNWTVNTAGEVSFRFSHEQLDSDGNPVYYQAGYQWTLNGGVAKLTGDVLTTAMGNLTSDIVHVQRPDWVLLTVDGAVQNQADLDAKSLAEAQRMLAQMGVAAKLCSAVGFWPYDTDGVCTEILWDQHATKTTVRCQDWYRPTGGAYESNQAKTDRANDSGVPHQGRMDAQRTAQGFSGSAPRTTPVLPPPPAIVAGDFWAQITAAAPASGMPQNQWQYSWQQVTKTSSGYGGWTAAGLSGNPSGNCAYNTIENMGSAAGLQGDGVNTGNLSGSFAIQPAPAGAIVRMWPATVQVSGNQTLTEYWFQYENGVDGNCSGGGGS